jgi:hypothetical protein
MARYLTLQNLADTSIVNGDLIGQIGFAASNDSDGGDAIAICSSISVKAEGTFDASNNPGAIVFATAPNNGPTDRLKITNEGHFVPIADISYDLGDSGLNFRNLYIQNIESETLTVDTNTLYVDAANNRIGIGTTSPAYQVEIENSGANALLVLDRTDGAACFIEGQASRSAFGSVGATPLALAYNSLAVVLIGANGAITVNPDGDGFTFPTTDGSANQVLQTDGSGSLSFATVSAGGGTPGGSVNQIQINDGAGGFTAAGSSDQFTFSNNVIELGRSSNNSGSDVRNTWFDNNFCIGGQNFSSSTDSDADFNTAVGINALGAMTFPDANTAVGYYSMEKNTLGNHNTAVGYLSLQGLIGNGAGIAGDYNVAIGSSACGALQGTSSNTASYNTAVGYQSQNSNQVHNRVTTLGYRAGYNVQSSNIYIGDDCPYATNAANGTGNLIIRSVGGYGNLSQFRGEGNNELCIGNIYAGNQATQRAGIGDVNTIGDSPDAALHIQPINSSDLVLKVQGAAAQSENLTNWENSSNVIQAYIDATGGFSGTCITFGDGTTQCTAAAGGGTPGGSDTHVQFNDGGSTFGGNAGFTYDKTAQKMYSRSYYTNITDSGNITTSVTLDLDQSNFHQVTLNGNPITLTVSNGDIGQRFIIRLKQDNTGSRTVNWFSTISWPGGGPPTLSTATGVADLLGFVVTDTNTYDGFLMVSGIY